MLATSDGIFILLAVVHHCGMAPIRGKIGSLFDAEVVRNFLSEQNISATEEQLAPSAT